jgi:tRNA nucleotidyltransferase (CCA-adding enzyme)
MEVFEVGGAVRDSLLDEPITERDWVVVGSSPEELLRLGYRQVGKDFPVFLHPHSGEEYALARTEQSVGPGYHGFVFDTSADVSLEEDLGRRDLTINAMAKDEDGVIVDPYGGQRDVEARVLRHTSPAFSEDPLRILRVARFAARFSRLSFTVAAETMTLMAEMVDAREADALRPERVWQETEKALKEDRPDIYFETLRECGALAIVFPEIDALFGVPQPPRWHPEIDTGIHTLMCVRMAARLSDDSAVRFAALTHDLGKATTPQEVLPRHTGHEVRSVDLLDVFCTRLPVPRRYKELACAVARHHGVVHRAGELRPGTVLRLIEAVDGIRRPERFEAMLTACEADARGRAGLEEDDYPQRALLQRALSAALNVDTKPLAATAQGPELGEMIREERLIAIGAALDIS